MPSIKINGNKFHTPIAVTCSIIQITLLSSQIKMEPDCQTHFGPLKDKKNQLPQKLDKWEHGSYYLAEFIFPNFPRQNESFSPT